MKKGLIIAIDGPVAAGKGVIAPLLSKRLNAFYLYTGGMYRSLALAVLREGTGIDNEEEVLRILEKSRISLEGEEVFLNGENVTKKLKDQNVVEAVPHIAIHHKVRKFMVEKQREIGQKEITLGETIVVEGRDAGTKIFPEADFKLFLTATPEVRAGRRLEQLKESGNDVSYEEVLESLKKRDRMDTEREAGPLVSDPKKYGYFILDNSGLSEEETVNEIIEEIKRKDLENDSN
jgi:CMP/dCMP kinase